MKKILLVVGFICSMSQITAMEDSGECSFHLCEQICILNMITAASIMSDYCIPEKKVMTESFSVPHRSLNLFIGFSSIAALTMNQEEAACVFASCGVVSEALRQGIIIKNLRDERANLFKNAPQVD